MADKKEKTGLKTILVPTDFSDKANRAIDFAVMIAGNTKARIVLLHVIELPHGTNIQQDKIRKEHEKVSKPALKEAQERAKTKLVGTKIKVETLLRVGAPVTVIIKTAAEIKADLICMGNRITTGLRRFVFDTTTSGVIDLTSCPVLATTSKLPEVKLDRLLFATDFKENDLSVLQKATILAREFKSTIHVLHIKTKPTFDEKLRCIGFESLTRKAVDYKNLHFKSMQNNDVEDGLDKAIAEIYPDLIILIHQNRSFLDAVFGSNVVDDLVYRAEIPVLVYPV